MAVKTVQKIASINKELRVEILEYAIILEKNINNLLVELLDVPDKKKKKSLSGKSGSLSFKNKIDLLFYLGVIDNDEYRELLILMEFRNKFLHDLHCNSFEKSSFFVRWAKKQNYVRFGIWRAVKQKSKYKGEKWKNN